MSESTIYFVYQKKTEDQGPELIGIYFGRNDLCRNFSYRSFDSKYSGGWTTSMGNDFGIDPEQRTPWNDQTYVMVCYADDKVLIRPETLLGWCREYHHANRNLRYSYCAGSKPSKTRLFRRPHTFAEVRQMSGWLREEGEPMPRSARQPVSLPHGRSEIWRERAKNWKAYRRTQWKS